jgi:hypothetical protein
MLISIVVGKFFSIAFMLSTSQSNNNARAHINDLLLTGDPKKMEEAR